MSISGIESAGSSSALASLRHRLFQQIDADGDGTITQSELETAVSGAGGSTSAADQLYASLDPMSTGSVTEAQFAAETQGALFQTRPQAPPPSPDQLFAQADSTGTGAITKSELEQAVTANGGTSAQADALFAMLDANSTGLVTKQQFLSGMAALRDGGSDGLASAAAQLFSQIDGNGDGTVSQSELEQAFTAAGGTVTQADSLYATLGGSSSSGITQQQFVSGVSRLLGHQDHAGGTPPVDQLFRQIDSTGSGAITKSQLESFFTANGGTAAEADSLFAKLDTSQSGSVTERQFVDGVRTLADQSGSSASSASQTTTVTNADGAITTTTTTTYPDDSKVSITTPAATTKATSVAASNGSSPLSQRVLAMLIGLQAQAA